MVSQFTSNCPCEVRYMMARKALLIAAIILATGATAVRAQVSTRGVPSVPPLELPPRPAQLDNAHSLRIRHTPKILMSTEDLESGGELPGLKTIYKIRFGEFMQDVEESNSSLAAQRFNIPIAQAQYKAAGVYPDPT